MATLNVQQTSILSPLANSFTFASAAGGGDVVPNATGGVRVMVKNNDASAKTVTVKSYYQGTPPAGTAKSDLVKSVGAGEVAVLGPFDAIAWNNGLSQVELTYSAVTSLFVAAIKGV